MNLFTQIGNKIQYSISKWASDPEAAAYAIEQAKQKQQDEEVQTRLAEAKKESASSSEAKAAADAEAKALAERSEFKTGRATSNIALGILKGFTSLIFIVIILYGGHLAANNAIGYKVPFRILSFVYGCLFFFIEIPKMLIRRYAYQIKSLYYTYLPISTYQPNGDLETFFLGAFCYKEDDTSQLARATVETLYKTAFEKSQIKTE